MTHPIALAEGIRHARDFLTMNFYMHPTHIDALTKEAARLDRAGMRMPTTEQHCTKPTE